MTNLVYPNERRLFAIAAVISGLVWLLLILGTIGIILIYFLLGFIAYLFVQSVFISYLRGSGVRLSDTQMPDLYRRVLDSCKKLGITEPPDAYLIHGDGIFNAFATRFLGRNFIVLYSEKGNNRV